jgi:hypothetical protein
MLYGVIFYKQSRSIVITSSVVTPAQVPTHVVRLPVAVPAEIRLEGVTFRVVAQRTFLQRELLPGDRLRASPVQIVQPTCFARSVRVLDEAVRRLSQRWQLNEPARELCRSIVLRRHLGDIVELWLDPPLWCRELIIVMFVPRGSIWSAGWAYVLRRIIFGLELPCVGFVELDLPGLVESGRSDVVLHVALVVCGTAPVAPLVVIIGHRRTGSEACRWGRRVLDGLGRCHSPLERAPRLFGPLAPLQHGCYERIDVQLALAVTVFTSGLRLAVCLQGGHGVVVVGRLHPTQGLLLSSFSSSSGPVGP